MIALLTAEAEYIAVGLGCAQVLWMKQTHSDFGLTFCHVPIKCDNTSAISILKNLVQQYRTKHIEIICNTPNPGVPLTTRQHVEFLWISGHPIPHGCVPFIGIHISIKNRAESPLFRKLYPTYNLYNNNP